MSKAVLLVDDGAQIRRDLGKRLDRFGYDVYKADSVKDAHKVILSEKIDYGIIDLKLDFKSDYGGLDVVKALKRHQPKSKTIVLSGWHKSEVQFDEEALSNIDAYVSKKGEYNYITEIFNVLNNLDSQAPSRTCFVIMPFSKTESCDQDEWDEIFNELIKPSVEGADLSFNCRRSNTIQGSIIEDILDNLNRADLVIADLTDRNPNVFYELGVRHTLRDSTILIAQHLNDIPFDLRHFAIHIYDWKRKKTRTEFKKKIKETITQLLTNPQKGASPIRKYLQLENSPNKAN